MAGGKSKDRVKSAALTKALRTMFSRLQARAAPDRLLSIVDQLDAPKPPDRTKVSPKGG